MAKFSVDVAISLGLKNPECYTSHSYKRSSLSFMADSGLSLPEFKSASGHRSDAVAQEYIDHSIIQKRKPVSALQFREKEDEDVICVENYEKLQQVLQNLIKGS